MGDPHADYRKGSLKFVLHGRRLHGGWALVRMRPRGDDPRDQGKNKGKDNWLLIKEHDKTRAARARAAVPARTRAR